MGWGDRMMMTEPQQHDAMVVLRQQYTAVQEDHMRLVQLIHDVAHTPDLEDVLRMSIVRMSELFAIERVSVVLFRPGDDIGCLVLSRDNHSLERLMIKMSDYPELQEMARSREPLVISDVFEGTLVSGLPAKLKRAQLPHRAAVLFPLLRKEQVIGALFLRSASTIHHVDDRLLSMGRIIASVTAVAIGHAVEHDAMVTVHRELQQRQEDTDRQLATLQQFAQLFAQSHDGIVVTDQDGRIRYANRAAAAILQCCPQSLHGRQFVDLLRSDSQQVFTNTFCTHADPTDNVFQYVDLHVPTTNDRYVVISTAARHVPDVDGVLISFRDVTQLRALENELKQTKDFLENLIQSSVDAIVACDMTGRVILFNRAAERMLGYSAEEASNGLTLNDLYTPEEAAEVMRRLRSESYGGAGRLESLRKDVYDHEGQPIASALTAAIIYEHGQEAATVFIFNDLREQLRMHAMLNQVQSQLQKSERQAVAMELAGAAAHELNQPLTAILGYSELLRRRFEVEHPQRKAIDMIYQETERMAGIVKRLGQITSYQTKPYVGGAHIIDLNGHQE